MKSVMWHSYQLSPVTSVLLIATVLCKTESQNIPFIRQFERVLYDHIKLRDHHVTRRSADELTFQFKAFERSFTPVLRRDHTHIHPNLVIETSKGTGTYHRPLPYSGYIKEEFSKVYGVLTTGGHFEGKIITNNETYFMERAIHHFKHADDFHTVVFKISDVTFNSSHTSCAHAQLKEKQKQMTGIRDDKVEQTSKYIAQSEETIGKYTKEKNTNSFGTTSFMKTRNKRAVDPTKQICELYMQADHKFFEKYGSDVDTVVEKLTQHVQAVDAVYKDTNFDGAGGADNIGFIIKKMKIWDDPQVEGYLYDGSFAVDYFLNLHSKNNFSNFCLSYLFTNQDFDDGVLGLAWLGHPTSAGGICEKHGIYHGEGKSINTGIVTVLNYGSNVPSAVSHVTLAHEIGHNFGSDHDPEGNPVCAPGDPDGNYIMYARATSGTQANNFKLSSCSIEQVYEVLEAKAIGTDGCFVAFTGEVCGNKVVEGTEECDCGWEDECTEGCCNPMVDNPGAPGVETPCTKKSSAVCSPSEGTCCNESCQYKADTVSCRAISDCMDEAFCAGTSAVCPTSGHRPNGTTCGDGENDLVCFNGECSGSICLAHGREPCHCLPDSSGDWKDKKLCQLCCKDGDTCKSSYELADIPNAEALAGQPCNSYQGYCDVFKICRQVSPEGPLSNLRKLFLSGEVINAVKDFLTNHWYVGLAAGLVFIISIVLISVLSQKGIPCAKVDQGQTRDSERHHDDSDRSNHVFATELSSHNNYQTRSEATPEWPPKHKQGQQSRKVKTIVVYTQRKGQTLAPKTREMYTPTDYVVNTQRKSQTLAPKMREMYTPTDYVVNTQRNDQTRTRKMPDMYTPTDYDKQSMKMRSILSGAEKTQTDGTREAICRSIKHVVGRKDMNVHRDLKETVARRDELSNGLDLIHV